MGRQILVQPSKGDGKGKVGGESVCGPQFLIVTYEPALFCLWVVVFHVSVMTHLAVSHLCDMNYIFFVIRVCGCGVRVCVVVHDTFKHRMFVVFNTSWSQIYVPNSYHHGEGVCNVDC